MRRRTPRVLLLAGLAGVVWLSLPGSSAAAVDCGKFTWKTPITPGGGCPFPDQAIIDGALEKFCPSKVAPRPETPGGWATGPTSGGPWAEHRYAGLRWTTYGVGCTGQWADSGASETNAVANQVDGLVNDAQSAAMDPNTTSPFDAVHARALTAMHDSFWTPWLPIALPGVGIVLIGALVFGRLRDVAGIAANLAVVLVGVTLIFSQPQLIPDASDAVTADVARRSATGLLALSGAKADPAVYPESYYRMSRAAWEQGAFCGNADAARIYGQAIIDAQSYTVTEMRQIAAGKVKDADLVKADNEAWLKLAERMAKDHPAAFACWSGQAGSRLGTAGLHLLVSFLAGFPVGSAAVAVPALKDLLRWILILAVAFGAVLLVMRRMSRGFIGVIALAFIGAPVVALSSAAIMFSYTLILADPAQAWWRSIVAALSLTVAVPLSLLLLARHLPGLALFAAVSHRGGRVARRAGNVSVYHRGGSDGVVTAPAAQRWGARPNQPVIGAAPDGDGRRRSATPEPIVPEPIVPEPMPDGRRPADSRRPWRESTPATSGALSETWTPQDWRPTPGSGESRRSTATSSEMGEAVLFGSATAGPGSPPESDARRSTADLPSGDSARPADYYDPRQIRARDHDAGWYIKGTGGRHSPTSARQPRPDGDDRRRGV